MLQFRSNIRRMLSFAARILTLCTSAALLYGCGGSAPTAGGTGQDDPNLPGLAFAQVPASAHLNGRFEVWVRLNDASGARKNDDATMVSIRVVGGAGQLHGTVTRRSIDGLVIFDDLTYDRWEPIRLAVQAPGFAEVTTRGRLPVRPAMRFLEMPPALAAAGVPLDPVGIELVDGRGERVLTAQPITLQTAGGVTAPGGTTRVFANGEVHFAGITIGETGSQTLVWKSDGLSNLVHGLHVHEGAGRDSFWLPAARVGVPYVGKLPTADDFQLMKGMLPKGLRLEREGLIVGVPAENGHAHFEVLAANAEKSSLVLGCELSVFDAAEPAEGALDALDVDGPYGVGSRDDVIPVPSRETTTRIRTFFPQQEGKTAAGLFPLVVFHHGAALVSREHPFIFDRYDHFLRRWASHGFVVATVDALDLIWQEGRLTNSTLSNMNAMAENQRATIAFFRQHATDKAHPLAGHVNTDRIVLAGHSRGGGATLIAARSEPAVVGGILLEPLDPMGTLGGEKLWDTGLPAKPFLLIVGGSDADVPYPMADALYERRRGPMAAPTVLGALHAWMCDEGCPPDANGEPGISRQETWAVTNAYALAFLRYVANGDLTSAGLVFGKAGLSSHLSPLGVFARSDRRADAILVDDFQNDTPGRNALGLRSSDAGFDLSVDEPSLASALRLLPDTYSPYRELYSLPDVLARANAHRLEWSRDGARYETALGGIDVRGRAVFQFRARTESEILPPGQVTLAFEDEAGNSASLSMEGKTGENGLGPRFSDVMVPLAGLEGANVDLARLTKVTFELGGHGTLLIDDLRFE